MKLLLQSEASECGLAALGTIASFHGLYLELWELRRRFPTSLKGARLGELIEHASDLGFSSRPVRLELDELSQLTLPCILHWDLNHFVVLKKTKSKCAVILDPAVGERLVSYGELSRHFTGVALELTPTSKFTSKTEAPRVRLRSLTGKVTGLKRSLAQIFAVAAVLELFVVVGPLLNQVVVDDVISSGDRDLLTVLVAGFGLLLVIQTAIGLMRSWMVIVLSQSVSLQWTGNVFAHLLRLPVAFFEKRHLGDITSRFGAVGAIQKTLTTSAVESLLDGLMALAALIMIIIYAPNLAIVTIVAVLAYGLLRWAAYAPFRDAAAERLVVAAKESTHFLETLRAITPLKLFGREEERFARWQNLIVEVQNRDVRTARMSMAFNSANAFIFGFENLIVLWLGAKQIIGGMAAGGASAGSALSIGMFFAFLSFKSQFSGRVSALINYAVDLKMLGLHAERLADICLEPAERDSVASNELAHLQPCIELRSVSFRYSPTEPWILKNVSLRIEAGESIALVGASGSGKTTLLKIALGLLRPTEGDVYYGGLPIHQLGYRNYRRQVGTVMQEDVLLTGSLADNIAFFDVRQDQSRIEECARMARLHEDIVGMPMGYQSLVGDLGSGLSGGQKQRLLLARALYKRPRVLALDEATSHLDFENERLVTNAIAQMQLTRIIIAHRPETIAGAERVVRIKAGMALEEQPKIP